MSIERKAFNFLKSYYDVYKKLDKKDDKIAYIEAIMEKQFFGVEPILSGMADFAYTSQKHAIDKSVKGFEDRMGIELKPPSQDPPQGYPQDPTEHPPKQEEEEEEGKGKGKEQGKEASFDKFWSLYNKKVGKEKTFNKWKNLKQYEIDEILQYVPNYVRSTPDPQFRKNPLTFLNNRSWKDEIIESKPIQQTNKNRVEHIHTSRKIDGELKVKNEIHL